MERNFYRDEVNHAHEPTQIEKDMTKFESEAAAVIKRFLYDEEIILSADEIIMLNLFFAVMGLRSKRAGEQFANQLTDVDKRFYRRYQHNGDYTDSLKRNLGLIISCRSSFEVMTNDNIDLPFKAFIERDTKGMFSKYFVVVDSGDNDNFIIGDTYPVLVTDEPSNVDMYSICPLSPKRTLCKYGCNRCTSLYHNAAPICSGSA